MESWRKVWREGLAPLLPTAGLRALAHALLVDDQHLLQGATTIPPPLLCVQDWPVEDCCPISYCGWKDNTGRETVGEVEKFFAQACSQADERLGEPSAVRYFINWVDDTPRDEMRRVLLAEVERELANREERP